MIADFLDLFFTYEGYNTYISKDFKLGRRLVLILKIRYVYSKSNSFLFPFIAGINLCRPHH